MEPQHAQPELTGRAAPRRRVGIRAHAPRIAWSLWAVTLTLVAGGLILGLANRPEAPLYEFWVVSLIGPTFATLGALIVSQRPGNVIGWIFCVPSVAGGIQMFCGQYATVALFSETSPLPGGAVAAWLSTLMQTLLVSSIFFLVLLFPNGRLPSPRWRVMAWTGGLAIAAWVISRALHPGPLEDFPSAENPFGVGAAAAILDPLGVVGSWVGPACFLAAIVSLTLRFYNSRGEERLQLKWFVYTATLGFLAILLGGEGPFGTVVWTLAPLSLPVSATIAILRYRLYDIDLIINRTLVYGTLTACVVGIYVLVVGYLGAVFRTDGNLLISLITTGLVAVLFAPLRERLQRGVDRLMYGERDDPYAVLSRLGERLEGTLAPEAVLPTIAQTVRQALKLPYAAIALGEGKKPVVAAESGSPVDDPLRLPLLYRGEPIGELLLGPRAGEGGFSAADRRLLEDLARQAGIAVHAARLTNDLQRSRERLVAAREEERRRLRRDLHDGLGPTLGSLTLKLDVASDMVEGDPAATRTLLRGLKEQAQSAVADVRRLVYALRPPALDDLGLLGAIRETAAQHDAGGLRISVDAPERLPPLPAAVEVAAYRIAQEALTNVARHAGASECAVRLALDEEAGALRLEVVDDGRGLPSARSPGVGLHSMRERAAELGGECVVESPPEGGTRVRASLPLEASGFGQQASGESEGSRTDA